MRLNTLFRLLGTVLYGFIGWEIGITLVGTTELNTTTWQVIIPATLIGAIFGFVLAPWLVLAMLATRAGSGRAAKSSRQRRRAGSCCLLYTSPSPRD